MRRAETPEDADGLLGRGRVVVADARVERLARTHDLVEGPHRLLERGVGVHAVVVEDVDVVEAHARERLVEAS